MGATGSSDGHEPEAIGCYYTEFPGPIETLADFVAALRAGTGRPGTGRGPPLGRAGGGLTDRAETGEAPVGSASAHPGAIRVSLEPPLRRPQLLLRPGLQHGHVGEELLQLEPGRRPIECLPGEGPDAIEGVGGRAVADGGRGRLRPGQDGFQIATPLAARGGIRMPRRSGR